MHIYIYICMYYIYIYIIYTNIYMGDSETSKNCFKVTLCNKYVSCKKKTKATIKWNETPKMS